MNHHLRPFVNPISGTWICPCGREFCNELGAKACLHPATGGRIPRMVDAEKPTEWWSPADEAILRGELAKLPRPAYIERDHDRMIYRPVGRVRPRRRWIVEVIGVWIAVAGIAAGLVLLMGVAGPGEPAPNRSTVTPTTYGPPSR